MKIIYSIILIILFPFFNVYAQDINLLDIDESEFPLIKASIEIKISENNLSNKIQILENNKSKIFNIDSVSSQKKGKTILFLLDNNFYKNKTSLIKVSNLLSESIDNLNKNDYVNLFITNPVQPDNDCITPLSYEFTDKLNMLSNHLYAHLSNINVSSYSTNLNCAIEKSLILFNAEINLTNNNYLVVLVNEFKSNTIDIEKLSKLANRYKIQLKIILCGEIIESLKNEDYFIENPDFNIQKMKSAYENSINIDKQEYLYTINYIIKFYTTQNEKINSFDIKFGEEKIECKFVQPEYIGFFRSNWPIIVLFNALIIIFAILLISLFISKKKVSNQLEDLQLAFKRKNAKTTNSNATESDNFGLLKKSSYPVVEVKFRGETYNHEIRKLITRIGRHVDNDIVISDLTISNHHAVLTNEGGELYIQDSGSTNGIYVNEIKVTKSVVKEEYKISLGKAGLKLVH